MPEISEIFEDTDVPNLTTASAAGQAKQEAGHGKQPTLGQEKVLFSPTVKLKASQATTQVPGTSVESTLKSTYPVSPQGVQGAQDDGQVAKQPTPGAANGNTGARIKTTAPPGPHEGRNSGGARLFSSTVDDKEAGSSSEDETLSLPPRKKAKTGSWRNLFEGGDPASCRPASGAGWSELISQFESMETEMVALEHEKEALRAKKNAAVAKYKNAHEIIVRMSAAPSSRDNSGENAGYRKGFKTTAKFNDGEDERIEDFFEQLDSDFNTFSVDSSTPGGARQLKEELIKALGQTVRAEYGRAKELLEQESPSAKHDYDSIKEFLLTRFHRPQSDDELLASWEKLRQLKSESVRAFMLRVDRMLAQMRTAMVEPAPKALVFALKGKVNKRVVSKVTALPGSENHSTDPSWWRHELVKNQRFANDDEGTTGMNALVNDGKGRGKGRGTGRGTARTRRYAARDGRGKGGKKKESNFFHSEAKAKGREFVRFMYSDKNSPQGAAQLWQDRVAHEDGGGCPTERPELYAHDKLNAFHNSGKLKYGYPKDICVKCGWTGHNAGTHKKKDA